VRTSIFLEKCCQDSSPVWVTISPLQFKCSYMKGSWDPRLCIKIVFLQAKPFYTLLVLRKQITSARLEVNPLLRLLLVRSSFDLSLSCRVLCCQKTAPDQVSPVRTPTNQSARRSPQGPLGPPLTLSFGSPARLLCPLAHMRPLRSTSFPLRHLTAKSLPGSRLPVLHGWPVTDQPAQDSETTSLVFKQLMSLILDPLLFKNGVGPITVCCSDLLFLQGDRIRRSCLCFSSVTAQVPS